MSERKHYRPRKVVDYSKFISQDSDDDDFTDHSYTRPSKKTKLSGSDSKIGHVTPPSKKIGRELPIQNKHSNMNKVEATNRCVNKENADKPLSTNKSTDDQGMSILVNSTSNKSDTSLQEFTKPVPIVHTDDSKASSDKRVETRLKKSNDNLQELGVKDENAHLSVKDNENRIELKNSETHTSIQGKPCTSKAESQSTKSTRNVSSAKSPTTINQSVIPKWKAPGPATLNSATSGNDGCSKPLMGLRLGLSRNSRVKSLHANVKLQL